MRMEKLNSPVEYKVVAKLHIRKDIIQSAMDLLKILVVALETCSSRKNITPETREPVIVYVSLKQPKLTESRQKSSTGKHDHIDI